MPVDGRLLAEIDADHRVTVRWASSSLAGHKPQSGNADSSSRALRDVDVSNIDLVEVLASYSNSGHAAELGLCLQDASTSQGLGYRTGTKPAWSLSERLSDAQRLAIVDAYRSGSTAAGLASTHSLSLSSLKRILRSARVARSTSA